MLNMKPGQWEEVPPYQSPTLRPALLLPACCLLIYVLCLAKTHTGGAAIKSGWNPSCGWWLVSLAAMFDPESVNEVTFQTDGRSLCQTVPDRSVIMRDECQRMRQKTKKTHLSSSFQWLSISSPLPNPNPSASLDRFQRLNLKMICPALLIIDEST